MAIHFVVQTFRKKGRILVPDQPTRVRDSEEALEKAQRHVGRCVGVVAYEIEVDLEVDYWGDPKVLYKYGETLPDFDDF